MLLKSLTVAVLAWLFEAALDVLVFHTAPWHERLFPVNHTNEIWVPRRLRHVCFENVPQNEDDNVAAVMYRPAWVGHSRSSRRPHQLTPWSRSLLARLQREVSAGAMT
jgi:hypothetical protein